MHRRLRIRLTRLACLLALAGCYTNRPVTEPFDVKGPIKVGFDAPTRLRALSGGDSVTLTNVTLLVGRVQRLENDTLYFVITEYVGGDVGNLGAPQVTSANGSTVIVPMSTAPHLYVHEWYKYFPLPIIAVVGVLALSAGIVALLLHGS